VATNAVNPVHNRVRLDFQHKIKRLDRGIAIAKQFSYRLDARLAHDTLLAKRAVLASLMSHSGSGTLPAYKNMVARDYKRRAYYPSRFNTLFDNCLEVIINDW
jgi:hypothetical protein